MQRTIRIDIRNWLERKFKNVQNATWPDVRVDCIYCHDSRGRLYIAVEDGKDEKKGWGFCQNQCGSVDFYTLYRDLENLTDAETLEQLYDDNAEPVYGKVAEILNQMKEPIVIKEIEPVPVLWPSGYTQLWSLDPERWTILVPKYMTDRKITKDMCDRYLLGFCENNYKFGGRVIVPIYQEGKLVGFQGRAMHPGIKPKYRFMDGLIAGDFLYNLDAIPKETDTVILTEGVFDVWAMVRYGFSNTVASFGKHLTAQGIKTLVTRFKKVLLCWDSDALMEIAELAEHLEGMIQIDVLSLNGKDPDESTQEEVIRGISNAVPYSKSFMRNAIINS